MVGDSIASLLSNEFNPIRAFSIFIIGATLYSFEIQKYFRWIEQKVIGFEEKKKKLIKPFLVLLYFNPLWIVRHFCFIYIFSAKSNLIDFSILKTAFFAFIVNIPISLIVNYIIQNKIPLKHRFLLSATFSGFMAIYYSISKGWF